MDAMQKATMEANLKAFLGSCRVRKNQPSTHTTMKTPDLEEGWNAGCYFIDSEYMSDFWIYYCNAVRKGVVPTITERPTPYGPLRVDFDFKAPVAVGTKRQYTAKILQKIVRIYQREILKMIDKREFETKMLYCLVLEKPGPRVEKGVIKDGFHFHFPYFICEGWVGDGYLRERVNAAIISENIWKDCNFLTPIDKIIDTNIAKKPWMLYGSMNYKNAKSRPYLYNRWSNSKTLFGHAFDENAEEMDIEGMFIFEMQERIASGGNNSVRYYLPRFLSIRGFEYYTPLTEELLENRKKLQKKKTRRRNIVRQRSPEKIAEDLKLIKDGGVMDMLDEERADEYDLWMEVGWTLFNVGEGCEAALQTWIDFSKLSYKFVEGECEEKWNNMELKGKTIGSLLIMAKKDSPEDYTEWRNTNVNYLIEKSLMEPKPTPLDVALVFNQMFGDRFICADAKKDEWYEFREHRWRETQDANRLRKLFVGPLLKAYCDKRATLNDELGHLEWLRGTNVGGDAEENARMESEHKKIAINKNRSSAVILVLKDTTFHDKLLKMCKIVGMHDPYFYKKLNQNPVIVTCENGVIDLETRTFRDGRPDDYSSFSTGLFYQEYSYDDEEVQELEHFLVKVFPNKNIRNYFLDFYAACLHSGNIHKRFLISTGESNGAKTITSTLLEHTFGLGEEGYYGKFPRALLVQATTAVSSSGPREELIHSMGKKIMGTDELTDKEKLNIGFIKLATGNDAQHFRGMWDKRGRDVRCGYTLTMYCNEPPAAHGDEAFWDRSRILPYASLFVKPQNLKEWPVPDTFDEQFAMKRFHADLNFKKKIPELAPVLLWYLFERYKNEYSTYGLVEPDEVLNPTKDYQAENDIYVSFIRDHVQKELDEVKAKKTFIKRKDLCCEFKTWLRENYPSVHRSDRPGDNKIRDEITKRIGTRRGDKLYGWGTLSRWWGYRLVYEDDEDEDSNKRKLPSNESTFDDSFLGK